MQGSSKYNTQCIIELHTTDNTKLNNALARSGHIIDDSRKGIFRDI